MKKILALTIAFLILCQGPSLALISTDEEARLGRQVLQMLRKEATFVEDPEVVSYVESVGQRIVAHIGPHYFPFRFFVIKDDAINAFAVPGGLVFINTGLIEVVDREDELAGVIAHELAHVQARHLAKRLEKLTRLNLATAAVTIAALLLSKGQGGNIIATTTNALAATKALSYSRADEEEADRLAFEYLVRAGYDPRGMIEVFNKIVRHSWLLSDTVPSYLMTHPTTPERISYLESLIENYHPKPTYHPDHLRLRRIQVRLKVLTHDAGSLVVRYRAELQKNPKDPLLHYGLGLALAKMRQFDAAVRELQYVIRAFPQRDMFLVDLARVYFEAGWYQKSLEILRPFVARHPESITARYFLARTYQEIGRYQEALPLFRSLREEMATNADFHYFLGKLYAALGKEGLAHYEFALHFRLTGDRRVALYHLRKAYENLPPDSPLRAEIKKQLKAASKATSGEKRPNS